MPNVDELLPILNSAHLPYSEVERVFILYELTTVNHTGVPAISPPETEFESDVQPKMLMVETHFLRTLITGEQSHGSAVRIKLANHIASV